MILSKALTRLYSHLHAADCGQALETCSGPGQVHQSIKRPWTPSQLTGVGQELLLWITVSSNLKHLFAYTAIISRCFKSPYNLGLHSLFDSGVDSTSTKNSRLLASVYSLDKPAIPASATSSHSPFFLSVTSPSKLPQPKLPQPSFYRCHVIRHRPPLPCPITATSTSPCSYTALPLTPYRSQTLDNMEGLSDIPTFPSEHPQDPAHTLSASMRVPRV